MSPQVDARPAALDALSRPGNPISWSLTFPAGYLSGRTFTASVGSTGVTPVIVGDVMTISLSAAQTTALGSGRHPFLLTDTTGDDAVRIAGRLLLTDSATSSNDTDVTINVDTNVAVDVTIIGASTIASVNGQTGVVVLDASDVGADPAGTAASAVAAEAASRASADTTLQTNIDAEATARGNAISALSGTYASVVGGALSVGGAALDESVFPATLARDSEVATAVANHVAAVDPHGDRAYADSLFAANDAMVFKGTINASGNPNYPAADAGHTYRISVAGKIGGASGPNVEAGDIAICLVDGTASGTHAAVGANWDIIQTNLDGAVIGPGAAVDSRFARFDGTSGKLLKDGGALVAADVTDASANGRAILTAADYAAMRTLLSLRPGMDVQAYSAVLASLVTNGAPGATGLALLLAATAPAARTATGAADVTDPFGFGISLTVLPIMDSGAAAFTGAGEARYFRNVGAAIAITKMAVHVGTSSGNISVAAYTNSGAGRSAAPTGGRLATSGAIACPATGYVEVSLGATVTPAHGDWLALSVDNTTANFRTAGAGNLVSNLGLGLAFLQATHPCPTAPASLIAMAGRVFILEGAP